VVLLPQTARLLRVDEELVHALADFGERIVGHEVGGRALVHGRPGLAVVLGTECARGRDPGVDRTVRRDLDRVAAHPAAARLPAVACGMVEETRDELPLDAAVARAKERARCSAQPQVGIAARLYVPCLLELELAILGQAELLGVLPGLPAVARSMHVRAVREGVGAGVEDVVAWVEDRVVDLPAGDQRAFDLPVAATLVARQQEEPLARAGENEHRR
jgi:hypothetical protein